MTDKIVIITGASSGIGEATAKFLASRGATVALAARRIDRLREIAAEIQANGGKASVHQVDDVVKQHGRLDVMVNNAGLTTERSPDGRMTLGSIQGQFGFR